MDAGAFASGPDRRTVREPAGDAAGVATAAPRVVPRPRLHAHGPAERAYHRPIGAQRDAEKRLLGGPSLRARDGGERSQQRGDRHRRLRPQPVKIEQPLRRGRHRPRAPVAAPGLGRDAEPRGLKEETAGAGQGLVGADARAAHAAEAFLLRVAAATGVVGRRRAARRQVDVDEELPHAAQRRRQRRIEQPGLTVDHLVLGRPVAPPRQLARGCAGRRGVGSCAGARRGQRQRQRDAERRADHRTTSTRAPWPSPSRALSSGSYIRKRRAGGSVKVPRWEKRTRWRIVSGPSSESMGTA